MRPNPEFFVKLIMGTSLLFPDLQCNKSYECLIETRCEVYLVSRESHKQIVYYVSYSSNNGAARHA